MDSVQSMASSSSSTVPSSQRTSHFVSQTEMEMESSKARHWSQLDYPTTESELLAETNFQYFDLLKEDTQWGRFFMFFKALEVGEKISEGAQADIYEARNKRDGPFNLVVKVMKGDAPLKAFQAQWPIGMLSATSLLTILGGTVLRDERLRGRFAFVMFRRWGDLRLLIDRRMKQERSSTVGPFPIDKVIHFMLSIAEDMKTLHDEHDILHRDLKASNVLVWGEFGKDISHIAPPGRVEKIGSLVADFECSVGVLGTGYWRAPEILEQLKARVPSSEVQFTRASDVYSYGMTCYEIVTGCIPYDGLGGGDVVSEILQGRRPELPLELPQPVRDAIVGCWHSDPSKRPSFKTICDTLKLKRGPNLVSVVIDNKSQRDASIVKVEQWNNPQALTLLRVMQELIDMDLLVLKASDSTSTTFDSTSTEMITQYFEVTDCKSRKVEDDKFIANITKALRLPMTMKWISESPKTSMDGNAIVQMHVVEIVAERSAGLLWVLSELLVATNFRVHSAGCCTREGRLECVIYVEGARLGTLLWEVRHNMEYFPISTGRFNMIVHRVATKEFSDLIRRLHNLKSMDLTRPRSPSNIRVYQEKECFCTTDVIVCLGKSEPLVHVSGTLADMNYKISGASVDYPGPYAFLRGRANKTEDIDVGTLGEDESNMIHRILDIATERGCPAVNGQIIVSGRSERLHDDLMVSLRENGLFVTGGQVCRHGGESDFKQSFPAGYLEFFVTETPAAAEAGNYNSMLPFWFQGIRTSDASNEN